MDATSIIKLALEVISDRLIAVLTLISCSIMCGWTMWGPTWERVVTLAIFTIFSYLLVKAKEKPNESQT